VWVWDVETGKSVSGPFKGHGYAVLSVAFSPDGKQIVSGLSNWTMKVWDAQTGLVLIEPFNGHTNKVWSVAFSPDGRHIVSGSSDWTVRVWDGETGSKWVDDGQGVRVTVLGTSFKLCGLMVAKEHCRHWKTCN